MTSSAIIPTPPGNDSNFFIGPILVMSKNLNKRIDYIKKECDQNTLDEIVDKIEYIDQ